MESEDTTEDTTEDEDICPNCGAILTIKWSGVECPKCGYWFCF